VVEKRTGHEGKELAAFAGTHTKVSVRNDECAYRSVLREMIKNRRT